MRNTARATRQPEIPLTKGRVFRERPSDNFVKRFRAHIIKTGSPEGFPGIAWTKPAADDIPVPLMKFATPELLRRKVAMAPCPVCSQRGPKYYEGILCWFSGDRRVRAIGHECGHDYFAGDGYQEAINEFDRAQKLSYALAYLRKHMPDLPRRMIEARYAIEDFGVLCRVRDDLVATITKKAVQTLIRSRDSKGALFIERDSGFRDHRGAGLSEKVTVTRPVSLDGLVCGEKHRDQTHDARARIGPSVVLRDHQHPLWRDHPSLEETLSGLAYEQLLALEGEHRSFEKVFGLLAADVAALRSLLTIDNLNELSRWGAHRDAATPFWIRATTDAVHAAKGPHTSAAGRRIAGWPLR